MFLFESYRATDGKITSQERVAKLTEENVKIQSENKIIRSLITAINENILEITDQGKRKTEDNQLETYWLWW